MATPCEASAREAAVASRGGRRTSNFTLTLDSGKSLLRDFSSSVRASVEIGHAQRAGVGLGRGLARDDVAVGAGLGHGPVQLQAFSGCDSLSICSTWWASSYSALMPPSGRAPACEVLPCTVR